MSSPDERSISRRRVLQLLGVAAERGLRRRADGQRRRHPSGRPRLARDVQHYDLGYFDDEVGRVEPIENPFGSKVLPMCSE